jgi:hypothetical protein
MTQTITNPNPHDVQPGQKWRDNNPRSEGAEFVVDEIVEDGGKIYAKGVRTHTGRKARILVASFHGGKRSGWTLIGR